MSEGTRKIREGWKLLIEGLLEDTEKLIPKLDYMIVNDVINHRLKEIGGYLEKARGPLPIDDWENLESKYYTIKSMWRDLYRC